jgi:hypothetical protein
MLKSISKLGTVLSKSEQQTINGGQRDCPVGQVLHCIYTANPLYTRCFCGPKADGNDQNG